LIARVLCAIDIDHLGNCPLSQAIAITIVTHDDAFECYQATLAEVSTDNCERGLAVCDRAIEAVGDDRQLHAALLINRTDVRLMMQDYARTVADAATSIAIERQSPVAYLNLGAGLVGLRRYGEALTALEKAIELGIAGRSHLAYYNRAIAREQLGDTRSAYFDYKKALEIDPNFAPAKEQLSRFRVITKSN
jgi:tetratricopeptide (TPR) repeat protein